MTAQNDFQLRLQEMLPDLIACLQEVQEAINNESEREDNE